MKHLKVYDVLHSKLRIGSQYDGGYVIVDLPGSYDAFISGGIANDVTFEQELMKKYPDLQKCIAFDGTIEKLPEFADSKFEFHRKNLGATNSATTCNLSDQLKAVSNAFLKIDIEGHEFRLLPSLYFHNCIKNVKQLVIEMHTAGEISLHHEYFTSTHDNLNDISNEFQSRTFQVLEQTHTLVHIHANNGCAWQIIDGCVMPNIFECTYVRNDYVMNATPCEKNKIFPIAIDQPNLPSFPVRKYVWYPFDKVSLQKYTISYGHKSVQMLCIDANLKHLCEKSNGYFEIPSGEYARAALFSDPVPGILKIIEIRTKSDGELFCQLTESETIVIES